MGAVNASSKLDSLFNQLDQTMLMRDIYDAKKLTRIDDIRNLLSGQDINKVERQHMVNRLIIENSTLSFDSTLFYINQNLNDSSLKENDEAFNETVLMQANLFAKSGAYKESLDLISHLLIESMGHRERVRYFNVYRKIYEDLGFYTSLDRNRMNYEKLYTSYTDSLLAIIKPESTNFFDIKEKQLRDTRRLDDCEIINAKRFANLKMGTPRYSLVAFERSLIYELKGDVEKQMHYLILSAISDIQASVKDNASLTKLSLLLFEQGEIEKAYSYIQFSFQDAEYFNSRLRFVEISNILPVITTAYQNIINDQNKSLKESLIIISILFTFLAFLLYYTYQQIKRVRLTRNKLHNANQSLQELNSELKETNVRLKSIHHKLVDADKVKEHYIGNFLNICSEFIDKLENYQHMVKRMVSGRKYEELMNKVNSQEFIEAEVQAFYKTFDSTFLNIYPDFVSRVNSLLQEDQKIELKKGEELNTELRIFALIRLGIEDSAQISKLLRYSVNTIYNYRAKVKNKALSPRDQFENNILEIDAFIK